MTIEEIKAFLDENKDSEEVKGFIGGLLTTDRVSNFLTTEDGKKLLQKEKDTHFTKTLDSWKKDNLDKLVEAEITKRNPAETEEQKRLRQIENELAAEKKSRVRSELKTKAVTLLTEKSLPISLADYFLGEDEGTTVANIENLHSTWQENMLKTVEGKFKENGRDIQTGGSSDITSFKPGMSMEEYAAMREKQGL